MWLKTLKTRLEKAGYTVLGVEDVSDQQRNVVLAGKHIVTIYTDGTVFTPNGDERLKSVLEKIRQPVDPARPAAGQRERPGNDRFRWQRGH